MKALLEEKKRRIEFYAGLCFNALVRADSWAMHGDSAAADAHRAMAAYWSGRAFGEVLA